MSYHNPPRKPEYVPPWLLDAVAWVRENRAIVDGWPNFNALDDDEKIARLSRLHRMNCPLSLAELEEAIYFVRKEHRAEYRRRIEERL